MKDATKLKVDDLITKAYKVMIENWMRYLTLLVLPFLIILSAGIALMFVQQPVPRAYLIVGYAFLIPLLMIPVVTSWHRFILLGANKGNVRIGYSVGREEWMYFKALVVLFIAASVIKFVLNPVSIAIVAGFTQVIGEEAALGLRELFLIAVIALIACRFLLILPAAAIGKKMGVAQSSVAVEGNAIRITVAYILAILLPQIILLFVGSPTELLAGGVDPRDALGVLQFSVSLTVLMLFYTLSVGVVSYAYKTLVLERKSA